MTELCPCMSIWAILGGHTVYCNFNTDEYRIDYDPCAVHDGWYKKDECPMHFTYEEVTEKVRALAEKEGLDVRRVFGISFKPKAKRSGIFKDVLEDLLYHVAGFKKHPEKCMTVLHVKIGNLDKFLEHGFCWWDSKGMIQNPEPFKVGDVGYVNLIDLEGRSVPKVFLELYAEDVGVELLEVLPVNSDLVMDTLTNKENVGLQHS